jgi:hypothetical protein
MTESILHPVRTVSAGGRQVEVRELKWKDLLAYLRKMGASLGEIVGVDGKFVVSRESVEKLIGQGTDLADELIRKTCREPGEWIDELSVSDALALLEAALELNLSGDLIERGKRTAGRIAQAFGLDGTTPTSAP